MEEQTASARVPQAGGLTCAAARDAVRDALGALRAPDGWTPERWRQDGWHEDGRGQDAWVQDVLTVVTELVSNARRHAGGVSGFQVGVRGRAVTVHVSDRSPRPPLARPWAPDRPGGFGWRLVHALADTVDVHVHHGGKTIVATFTPPRRTPR